MAGYDQSSETSVATQVSVLVTTTQLKPARPTRKRMIVRNNDGSNPIYINGEADATTSHFIVKAGESIELDTQGVVNAIATGATVVVHIWEEFN